MKIYQIILGMIFISTLIGCDMSEYNATRDWCNKTFTDLDSRVISINTLSPGIYYDQYNYKCCVSVSTSTGDISFPDYCHSLNESQVYELARYIEANT